MRRQALIVLFLASAAAAPAAAAGGTSRHEAPPALAGALMQDLARDLVSEEDIARLFAHLRETLLAASRGEPSPPPPPELARRGEAIAAELKARGAAASLLMLRALEQAALQALRELNPPPGPPAL